jgi:hypothetical protein
MQKKFLGIALILLVTFGYATTAAAAPAAPASQTGRPPIARNIVSTQLPATLLKNIRSGYNGYWITECYEKGKERRPDYFITLENADQIVQLKASHKSTWEVVSTQLKA